MGVEVRPKGLVERSEETLPAQVAIKQCENHARRKSKVS